MAGAGLVTRVSAQCNATLSKAILQASEVAVLICDSFIFIEEFYDDRRSATLFVYYCARRVHPGSFLSEDSALYGVRSMLDS